jgi:hypothetical protein
MAAYEKNNVNRLIMEENKNIEEDQPFDSAQDGDSATMNEETVQPVLPAAAEELSTINHQLKTWKYIITHTLPTVKKHGKNMAGNF